MMALINLVGATVYAQLVVFAKRQLAAGPIRRRWSFSLVEHKQLIITVDRVGLQPGVEAVEVGEPARQVGHQAAKQLGPDDQLRQGAEVGDGARAVGVSGRLRPQPYGGRAARAACHRVARWVRRSAGRNRSACPLSRYQADQG
jgi:hypothetical protein